ncbi:MAG TPA: TlpA disulfide reductase family protein [Blastocatellia bacterium]|nr:TlpA disulfide reductase family protein [Blastocatellia bacterium]
MVKKIGKKPAVVIGLVLAVAVVVVGGAMIAGSGRSGKRIAISPTPLVIDSVQQSLDAYRGKVVILDFWATWCGPCRMEIPGFITLQNKYRDQGLEIVGISIDPIAPRGNPGGAPAVAPFMQSNGINYSIFMVNNAAALKGYNVSQGIPTTYVLDRSGNIVKTYVGAQPMSVFENDINSLL